MRVDNLGKNVDVWYETESGGNGSSTHDVCLDCHSQLRIDPHCFDNKLQPYNGDPQGEDGWGSNVEHPPYEDVPELYRCQVCDKPLTHVDD